MNLVSVIGREKDLIFLPLSPSFIMHQYSSHPLPLPRSFSSSYFIFHLYSFPLLVQNVFRYVALLLLPLLIFPSVLNFFTVLSLSLSSSRTSLLYFSLRYLFFKFPLFSSFLLTLTRNEPDTSHQLIYIKNI